MNDAGGVRGRFDEQRRDAPDAAPSVAYLLAEFDTAWRHLGGLEDKRLKLFLGYCVVATGTLAVALLPAFPAAPGLACLPGLWLVLLSVACRQIAVSERQATERYRNKINLLRRTLLESLDSAALTAMQHEGNAWALQIAPNAPKDLRVRDVFTRQRWNTALFMKLLYDAGAVVGVVLAGAAVVR